LLTRKPRPAWPSFDLTTYSFPLRTMIETVSSIVLGTQRAESDGHTVIDGELKARRSTQRNTTGSR